MTQKVITISDSQFVEKYLYLNGKPFSFKNYEFMPIMYDLKAKKKIFKTSRQTSKSTTLANMIISHAATNPYSGQLFVSPSADQTKIFSADRIAPVIESSPLIKKYYVNSSVMQNVFTKKFLNGSLVYLRYAQISPDRLRGMSVDRCYWDECYIDTTEVLTEDGWKLFKDTSDNDVFATVNKKGNLEYQKASRHIIKDHEGVIINLKARSFNLGVTPKHNLFTSQDLNTGSYRKNKYGYTLNTAAEMLNKTFKMKMAAPYISSSINETFTLPGYSSYFKPDGTKYLNSKERFFNPVEVNLKHFMRFLGWFISEGNTIKKSNSIQICQDSRRFANEIREDLKNLGIPFKEYTRKTDNVISFKLNNRVLADYLKKLGKHNNKYIPKNILNKVTYLPDLLDTLYKGDAILTDGHKELVTTSKRLSDDVQIAHIYLGKRVSIRETTCDSGKPKYLIRPLEKNYQIFSNSWASNNSSIKEVPYKGKVYCATVPNGTLIVRDSKEKMAVISGNCQDQNPEIIPVVEQAMSRSLIKESVYAGTPKRTKGTLADLWYNSTMYEWIPKCGHCGKWNFIDERTIGLVGPICNKCGGALDTRKGQWVLTGDKNSPNAGFRISLPMFAASPWVDWQNDIIEYRKNLPSDAIFYNEVLGLEYDTGITPVTIADLKKCCTGGPMLQEHDALSASYSTTLGLDYGPVNSLKSKTVASIVQRRANKTHVLYMKKYNGPEADYAFIHNDIPRMFYHWRAKVIGADAGLGDGPNAEIRSRVGHPARLVAFRYSGSLKVKGKWNPLPQEYTISRNITMTELFQRIKDQKMVFPRWEEFEPFAEDFLNIAVDYDMKSGATYKYVNDGPDDSVHSILFGDLSSQLLSARSSNEI